MEFVSLISCVDFRDMWMYVIYYCEEESTVLQWKSAGCRFSLWMCLFPLCCRGSKVSTAKRKRPIHGARISSPTQDQETRQRKCFDLSVAVTSQVSVPAMASIVQELLPRHKSGIFPFKLYLLTFTHHTP
jgi:hypothetical protein